MSQLQRVCQRCGTCCRKGPPGLHREDAALYEQGRLHKEHLLTLRQGEWVYDNVLDQRTVLDEDLLRLRSQKRDPACLYFDGRQNSCQIYAHRPLECRVLNCQDTTAITGLYQKNRLSRWDLVAQGSALFEIMLHHEQVCAYHHIRHLAQTVRARQSNRSAEADELWEIIQSDRDIRGAFQEKTGAGDSILEFLFGRPLSQTLPGFGLEIRETEQGCRFLPYP